MAFYHDFLGNICLEEYSYSSTVHNFFSVWQEGYCNFLSLFWRNHIDYDSDILKFLVNKLKGLNIIYMARDWIINLKTANHKRQ